MSNKMYRGNGAPGNGTGVISDFYLDIDSFNLYKKNESNQWQFKTTLIDTDWLSLMLAKNDAAIELQKSATHIQWRYVGDVSWIDLVLLTDIKGDQGNAGADGTSGSNGATWLTGSGVPAGGTGNVNDLYLNTANGDYYLKTGVSTWTLQGSLVGSNTWTVVKKTTDQTKSANTTLANDTSLLFTMNASTKYHIRGRIFFDTTAAADFKWRHIGPGSPTLVRICRKNIVPGATALSAIAVDVAYSAADIALTGTGTNGGHIEIDAIIHNGANAGSFAFQWAQNASDAGNTIVRAGSYLEYATF